MTAISRRRLSQYFLFIYENLVIWKWYFLCIYKNSFSKSNVFFTYLKFSKLKVNVVLYVCYVYKDLFYKNSGLLQVLFFIPKLYDDKKYYILNTYFYNEEKVLYKESIIFQKKSWNINVANIRILCIVHKTLFRPSFKNARVLERSTSINQLRSWG